MTKHLNHDLGDEVMIETSNTPAQVIGRAEYLTSEPSYLLRYTDGTGSPVENWWTQSALAPV
jgi:hypothetical protein